MRCGMCEVWGVQGVVTQIPGGGYFRVMAHPCSTVKLIVKNQKAPNTSLLFPLVTNVDVGLGNQQCI